MNNDCFENVENIEDRGCNIPDSLKDILKKLKGKVVCLVFKGCCKETVEILDVRGELCICRTCNGKIKFVRIECICGVVTNCPDLFLQF